MVVAHVYRKADAPGLRPVYWWLLCLAALVALTVRTSWFSPGDSLPENLCFTVLPAAVIVLAVVMLEKAQALPRIPALVRLGDASYSVYLSHILLLGIVRLVWSKAGLAGPSFAHALGFAGTSLVIVVAGSLVVYLLVEKPITARLQEQVRNCRRIAPAQAS
jgi:exopolysaccharide production protein ExoZ